MRKVLIAGILLLVSAVIYGCGGGSDSGSASGNVVLFATDDMSSHKQVTATIRKVQLVNPGAVGLTCDVLISPVTLDLANLSSVVQLLNVGACPVDFYSILHLEFDKEARLMDQDNTAAPCFFTSYKDSLNQSNPLTCEGNICSLDINTSFRVFANQNSELPLDFDLKEFEISNFPSSNCSVAMKVSPLSSSELNLKKMTGYKDGLSGLVGNLSTQTNTFTIAKGDKTFIANYSQVSQQNIDQLLQFAVSESLTVQVESSSLNVDAGNFAASAVFLKIGGAISDLNVSNNTFRLTYHNSKTITVDFGNAQTNGRVEGQLNNGLLVALKVGGYDGSKYSAYRVEVTDLLTEE